jgi:hypothetical protein
MLLLDREISSRQQAFGVELYDYVSPMTKSPDFYASDDTLTVTLQPSLITAQREISALEIKKGKLQEQINQAAVKRAGAFKKATNWQETLANAAKSTALAGNEAKLSTEMALLKGEITYHKQQFGISFYQTLEELEDTKNWLPTDREIRSIYDNCRKDIEASKKRKGAKEIDLKTLEGDMSSANASSTLPEVYATPVPTPAPNAYGYAARAPAAPSYTNAYSAPAFPSYPSAQPVPTVSSAQPTVPYATPVPTPSPNAYAARAPPAPSHTNAYSAPAFPPYPSAQPVATVSSVQPTVRVTAAHAAPSPIPFPSGQPDSFSAASAYDPFTAATTTHLLTSGQSDPFAAVQQFNDLFATSNQDPFVTSQQFPSNPPYDPFASNQDPFAF